MSFGLNLEGRSRGNDKKSYWNEDRLKLRNGRSNSRFRQNVDCWNYGKTSHIKKHYRASKKKEKKKR